MLAEEGYATPTEIQAQAIPPALAGKDVLGIAQTGTGKTAAFALPIIQKLQNEKLSKKPFEPRALILSPTRELAAQIAQSFATYGRGTGLRHTVVFGGVSQYHQERALERGVDILVATPGRLIDLLEQGVVSLSHIHTFVLDEADRMLDMGFIDPIRRIAGALSPKRPTMPPEIAGLAASLLHEPVRVAVHAVASAAPKIEQVLYQVPRERKFALLGHVLKDPEAKKVLVFIKTKHNSDKITKRLRACGERAETIHGNKAQSQRTRALDGFRSGRTRVLVATDVAARGLDVDDITHVVNFDLPIDAEAYVHRIGRTGRAGATGIAIAFCDDSERNLLRNVERLIKKPIPRAKLPADLPDMKPATDAAKAGHAAEEQGIREDLPHDVSVRREYPRRESGGKRFGQRQIEHASIEQKPFAKDSSGHNRHEPKSFTKKPHAKPGWSKPSAGKPDWYKPADRDSSAEQPSPKKHFAQRSFEKKNFTAKPFDKGHPGQKKSFGGKSHSPRAAHPFEARLEVEADRHDQGGGRDAHADPRAQTHSPHAPRDGGHVGFGKRGGFKKTGFKAKSGFKPGGFKKTGFQGAGFKKSGFQKTGFKRGGFKGSGR
jgi:ATP-dependent RNA helicase RhlE